MFCIMCINAIGKIYLCLRRPSLLESRAGIRMQTFKSFHFPCLFVGLFQKFVRVHTDLNISVK